MSGRELDCLRRMRGNVERGGESEKGEAEKDEMEEMELGCKGEKRRRWKHRDK